MIARDVADALASPETEASLASKWNGVADLSKVEDIATVYQLEKLLNEQAVEAGFTGYSAVRKGAAKNDEKAVSLAGSEDFSRRWSMLESVVPKLGFPQRPGEPILIPQHLIQVGPISTRPDSNVLEMTIWIGRFGGLMIGGILVLALLRWKPGFMRPAPREPDPFPARATAKPKANNDPW